ncbi:hypothetical protein D3C80_1506900 [compost metagenome]
MRAERSNSGWPKYCSSCFICRLTALGVRFTCSAARAKLPCCTTEDKVESNCIFMSFSRVSNDE